MAFTLTLTSLAASAQAQPGDTLGVYAGAGAPSAVTAFEKNLGRPVSVVHETFSKQSWSELTDIDWFLSQWGPTNYAQRVVYTVPMLPNSGGTLAEGAAGSYNTHFRLLALKLVAGGQGNATLRIGPEFNGSWFKWTIAAPNGGPDFAAYWRQIVTTMRSVPGANFKFDWCPNGGSSYVDGQQLQAETAWPGDAYVDYVGLDVYDQSWSADRADPAARWSELVNVRNGLRWQRDFAAAHGKAMTFPEWGLSNRADGYGGGDSPYFVEQMYEWIRTSNVAFHMYFEYADADSDYAIFGGSTPNAARRFVELFGSGATGRPLAEIVAGTPAAGGTTAAGRSAGRRSAAGRRCVTRVVKKNGKVVRRNGKVVRRTTCTTKKVSRRCVTRVVKKNGKVVRRNGKVVRKTTCVASRRVVRKNAASGTTRA